MKCLFLIVFPLLMSPSLHAEDFGIGLIGLSNPHYMGADQNYNLIFPVPLFSSMFNQKDKKPGLYFDFAADLNLPIGSQDINSTQRESGLYNFDNFARRGMDSIPLAFYLGAKAGYRLGPIDLVLHITPGLQIGDDWNGAGILSRLELNWYLKRFASTEFVVVAKSKLTDKRYNNLYYGVETRDVIAGRKEFSADSGYLGSSVSLHYHSWKPINSFIFGAFVEYQNMSGSVVEDSDLVENENNLLVGVGIGFLFE